MTQKYRLLHIPTLRKHLHIVNDTGKEAIIKRYFRDGSPLYLYPYTDGTFSLRVYREEIAEYGVSQNEFVWTEVDEDGESV